MKTVRAEQRPRGAVEITWKRSADPRRLRRVAEILADIMDTADRSGGT